MPPRHGAFSEKSRKVLTEANRSSSPPSSVRPMQCPERYERARPSARPSALGLTREVLAAKVEEVMEKPYSLAARATLAPHAAAYLLKEGA